MPVGSVVPPSEGLWVSAVCRPPQPRTTGKGFGWRCPVRIPIGGQDGPPLPFRALRCRSPGQGRGSFRGGCIPASPSAFPGGGDCPGGSDPRRARTHPWGSGGDGTAPPPSRERTEWAGCDASRAGWGVGKTLARGRPGGGLELPESEATSISTGCLKPGYPFYPQPNPTGPDSQAPE